MMEKEVYTILDAARYVGVYEKMIYSALKNGELQGKKDGKQGNKWLIEKASLDIYKRGMAKKEQVIDPTPLPANVEKPTEKPNDGILLQNILLSTFNFLAEHSFSISIKSLEEVEADFRHWLVKTPDTTLDIVASGEQITILSQKYQRQLEEQVDCLNVQLKRAETTLSLLRQKKKEVLLPYAYDLPVWVEQRHESVLVYCDLFPFSSMGKNEQEALAAFKRVLKGYCWQLHTHEKELTVDLRAQLDTLKELLVEDDYS